MTRPAKQQNGPRTVNNSVIFLQPGRLHRPQISQIRQHDRHQRRRENGRSCLCDERDRRLLLVDWTEMNIANPSKAMIALVALVCVTLLLMTDSISNEAGTGLIGMIAGYAVGNGIAARRGDDVTPIIGKKS